LTGNINTTQINAGTFPVNVVSQSLFSKSYVNDVRVSSAIFATNATNSTNASGIAAGNYLNNVKVSSAIFATNATNAVNATNASVLTGNINTSQINAGTLPANVVARSLLTGSYLNDVKVSSAIFATNATNAVTATNATGIAIGTYNISVTTAAKANILLGNINSTQINAGTLPVNVVARSLLAGNYLNDVKVSSAIFASNANTVNGFGASAFAKLSSTQTFTGRNTFSNPSTFGQITVSSITITNPGTVLLATATYSQNSGKLNGFAASAFAKLSSTQTFTGRNTFPKPVTFGQITVSSITITNPGTVLLATATYSQNSGKLNGFGASAFAKLSSTQTFTGRNTFNNPSTFGQITVSSITITNPGTVLLATATYSQNSGKLNGFAASAFAKLSSTQTFTGRNTFPKLATFGQITVSSITITNPGTVLLATATYSQNSGQLNGFAASAFAKLSSTQTFTGTNTFKKVTISTLTITAGITPGTFNISVSTAANAYRKRIVLASDVINSNVTANTIADVTGLSFTVTSGTTYRFYAVIAYTSALATTGSSWSINGPATTLLNYTSRYTISATSLTTNYASAYNIPATANTGSLTAGNVAVIEGVITPSAAGTVVVRFASGVSNSAITAKAGSTLEVW
jgi:tetrahydromethanopterin S-methyltransferase subunit F